MSSGKQTDSLLKDEETYWAQRAKSSWLAKGDKNTKFFHARAFSKKRSNRIEGVEDQIRFVWKKNFCGYFHDIFTTSILSLEALNDVLDSILSRVIPKMNSRLVVFFIKAKIKSALMDMHPSKSLGPDGFPTLFCQEYWNSVGPSLVNKFLSILNQWSSPASINSTYITLIPKIKNPKAMGQYRPINLCNVSYNVITKAIANRFKLALDRIILCNQSVLYQVDY